MTKNVNQINSSLFFGENVWMKKTTFAKFTKVLFFVFTLHLLKIAFVGMHH